MGEIRKIIDKKLLSLERERKINFIMGVIKRRINKRVLLEDINYIILDLLENIGEDRLKNKKIRDNENIKEIERLVYLISSRNYKELRKIVKRDILFKE